jgi:hypothetical protein
LEPADSRDFAVVGRYGDPPRRHVLRAPGKKAILPARQGRAAGAWRPMEISEP